MPQARRGDTLSRTMLVLFQNEFAVITREQGFVRTRRTSVVVPQGPSVYGALDDLKDQFRIIVPLRERKGWGLLIDTRDAPIAANDEVADPLRPLMSEMMLEFSRVAILVRTALGVLQATRRAREEAGKGRAVVPVFSDENAAINYLRTEDPAIPPPRSSRHG